MTNKPLHDYIDMEAYDVVAGQTYRDLVEQFEAYERVVEQARIIRQLEETGIWPDFQPLADALDALNGTLSVTYTTTYKERPTTALREIADGKTPKPHEVVAAEVLAEIEESTK